MRKIYFLGLLFILCISFFIPGCKKNLLDTPFYKNNIQNVSEQNILSIKEAQNWYASHSANFQFRNDASENKFKFKIRSPYWDKAINTNDSNYYIVEAPLSFYQSPGFTLSNTSATAQPEKANDVAHLLILKNKKTGNMRSAIMHIVSDNGSQDSSITYSRRNDHFSGYIFYTDLNGNFINGWKYENGRITRKSSKDNKIKKVNNRVGMGQAVSLMAPPEPDPVDCSVITVTEYVRDCMIYPNGEKNCTPWRIEGQHDVTYCNSAGSSGGIGGDMYNENDVPANADNFDNKIEDSLIDPCLSNILTKIKNLETGKVGKIIQEFSGDIPNWNWKLKEGSFPANINGQTSSISGGILTVLDFAKLKNATNICIARTIIHESIHAYLTNYFRYDAINANKDYPEMLRAWQKFKHPDYNNIQHDQIEKSFVGEIASALKEFGVVCKLHLDDNIYNDLAWGGLDFENNSQLSDDDKVRIQNRLSAEQSNSIYGDESPAGTKACN